MRRWIYAALLSVMVSNSVGCILPAYSGDPARRTEELLYTSEDLRAFMDEWQRFWFLDQPSHMKPYRTHGGII